MKDVLPCVGGMRVFLPLLEQIHYHDDTHCEEEMFPYVEPPITETGERVLNCEER